jgi:hypothetical protein
MAKTSSSGDKTGFFAPGCAGFSVFLKKFEARVGIEPRITVLNTFECLQKLIPL